MSNSKVSSKLKFKILYKSNFICSYCEVKHSSEHLHVDHLVPVSKGGGDQEKNLVCSCIKCNLGKSDNIIFPHNMIIDHDQYEPDFNIIKRFNDWAVMYNNDCIGISYEPRDYWIDSSRFKELDWNRQISSKKWGIESYNDFLNASNELKSYLKLCQRKTEME